MEMLRETFFMKGFITAMVIAVLTKVIVWANYHRLLVSSEEMERPKRYWIGTLKKKIENYYNLQTKVNNISCIVDKYFVPGTDSRVLCNYLCRSWMSGRYSWNSNECRY